MAFKHLFVAVLAVILIASVTARAENLREKRLLKTTALKAKTVPFVNPVQLKTNNAIKLALMAAKPAVPPPPPPPAAVTAKVNIKAVAVLQKRIALLNSKIKATKVAATKKKLIAQRTALAKKLALIRKAMPAEQKLTLKKKQAAKMLALKKKRKAQRAKLLKKKAKLAEKKRLALQNKNLLTPKLAKSIRKDYKKRSECAATCYKEANSVRTKLWSMADVEKADLFERLRQSNGPEGVERLERLQATKNKPTLLQLVANEKAKLTAQRAQAPLKEDDDDDDDDAKDAALQECGCPFTEGMLIPKITSEVPVWNKAQSFALGGTEGGSNWLQGALLVGAVVLVVGVIAIVAFVFSKKHRASQAQQRREALYGTTDAATGDYRPPEDLD